MRLLDRYIFLEALAPFLFGMAAFNSILVASIPLRRSLRYLVEDNLSLHDAALMLLYGLPEIIAWTFPMAMLLAALLGVGRLSSDSEAAAMLAGGASFYRLVAPVLVLGLLVSGLAFVFNESVVPSAKTAGEELLLRLGKRAVAEPRGVLVLPEPKRGPLERLVVAQALNEETSTLSRPDVYFYSRGKPWMVISSKEAVWQGNRWRFVEPTGQSLAFKRVLSVERCREIVQAFDKSPEEIKEERSEVSTEQMRLEELRAYIASLRRRAAAGIELTTAQVEYHNRHAVPLASFLFALIGAPLAMRPQRTTVSLAFGMSVLVIFLYYVVWYNASWFGNNGRLDPLWASWLSNILLGGVGLILLIRRAR